MKKEKEKRIRPTMAIIRKQEKENEALRETIEESKLGPDKAKKARKKFAEAHAEKIDKLQAECLKLEKKLNSVSGDWRKALGRAEMLGRQISEYQQEAHNTKANKDIWGPTTTSMENRLQKALRGVVDRAGALTDQQITEFEIHDEERDEKEEKGEAEPEDPASSVIQFKVPGKVKVYRGRGAKPRLGIQYG